VKLTNIHECHLVLRFSHDYLHSATACSLFGSCCVLIFGTTLTVLPLVIDVPYLVMVIVYCTTCNIIVFVCITCIYVPVLCIRSSTIIRHRSADFRYSIDSITVSH